jgi:hypothetical protein
MDPRIGQLSKGDIPFLEQGEAASDFQLFDPKQLIQVLVVGFELWLVEW